MAVRGFGEIEEKLRRSTVVIHSAGRSSGSGVIWSSDGTIITNAQVAPGAKVSLQLWDGRELEATSLGFVGALTTGVIHPVGLLRLEFLRGDYSRVRRVTVQMGVQNALGNFAAA